MKEKYRRLAALVLATLMELTLVGCGGKDATATADSPSINEHFGTSIAEADSEETNDSDYSFLEGTYSTGTDIDYPYEIIVSDVSDDGLKVRATIIDTPNSIVLPCLDFECHFVSADENISFTSEEYSISDIVDMDAYEYYNYYNSRSSKFLQDSEDIRISFSGWFETAGSSCCLEFTLWNNEDSVTIPLGQTIAYRTNGANLADRFLSYISEETYDTPVSSNHTDEYRRNLYYRSW